VRKPSGSTRAATTEIPALSLRADVRADSIDTESRTAELVWTTGARVLRGFFDRFYEELSLDPKHVRMGRLESGRAPLLDTHNGFESRGVVGVVETARLDKRQGVATVRFAKNDEDADRAWNKIEQGILRNVSVGYRVYKYEKTEGGDGAIPVYRAVDWEPYEVSVVPMGADDGAKVRDSQGDMHLCEIVSRAGRTAPGEEEQAMTDAEKKAAEDAAAAKRAAEEPSTARTVDVEGERAKGAEAERERGVAIRRAVRLAKLPDAVADELVASGASIDKARATILDKLATDDERTPTVQHVRIADDETERFQRGASDWLISKAGVTDRVVEAAKRRGETVRVEPGEFRGLTFVELARMCYERSSGKSTRGWDKMRVVGEALTYRASGGLHTTSDFAVLLENTMHKTLLAAYAITPDTWSRFCAIGSVSDFRPHNRYRTGSFSRLERLTEHGEFKNKSIPDATKESISADTLGNIIGLSRQAIINDDMGAFSRLSMMLGRAAALSIEMDVYAALALNGGEGPLMSDGLPLFDAAHDNISTGSALTVAGLDADRVVMASQTDRSGNEILDLRPAVLLVPIGLGGDARVLNGAEFDVDQIGAGSNLFMVPNRVRGLFRDIVDTPRLAGTRRYLFADPGQAAVLEVAFLDGAREPFLEVKDGWRIDGVEWKVRLDYGVAAIDYVGAVTNAGA
jgi:HK97 family phage prohead protease